MFTRMAELTFTSTTPRADPFNDVDVDVVFEGDDARYRVPAFWSGGQDWTVRFAPANPGRYAFRVESTDPGHRFPDPVGEIAVAPYRGANRLLHGGPFRVSANRRHFEQADGTPFLWLADTWWSGMSDRLSWEGFQTLTADRRAKGFTAIQLVAGLVPFEELAPVDDGFANEGGPCWTPGFERINPRYFDFMDRRIEHLIDNELAPVIVGAWFSAMPAAGLARLEQHWRYLIARYGAYPVFWIVGGEVADAPPEVRLDPDPVLADDIAALNGPPGSWTELTRYVRDLDPYGHPVSVHEMVPDYQPIQDESLLDFRFFLPAHFEEASLALEVAQLGIHYARTVTTKPLVVGEIGYEGFGGVHLDDFQRRAFWLGALNGSAGHSYGADGVFESYTADRRFHRKRHSFVTWEEGMRFPGSRHVGYGANLLRTLPWWRFEPRPDWITPHGTTMLEPRADDAIDRLRVALKQEWGWGVAPDAGDSEWRQRGGNHRLPYCAGSPGEARVVYIPSFGLSPLPPPTVTGLEDGVRYRASYWQPSSGITVDLGIVGRPVAGRVLVAADADPGAGVDLVDAAPIADVVVETRLAPGVEAEIVLRRTDGRDGVIARYTPDEGLALLERVDGVATEPLGTLPTPGLAPTHMVAEVRGGYAAVAVTDGKRTVTAPIVAISRTGAGRIGVTGAFSVVVRDSPALPEDAPHQRRLLTAENEYRGELRGPDLPDPEGLHTSLTSGWDRYATERTLLLDAYLPDRLPTLGDWLLILRGLPAG